MLFLLAVGQDEGASTGSVQSKWLPVHSLQRVSDERPGLKGEQYKFSL